jgi:arylsulfatase A-like enzyme
MKWKTGFEPIGIGAALALSGCMAGKEGSPAATQKPNILMIVVDDLGISDVGCYGRDYGNTYHETPNIDRLASEGMRFINAYAASAVCSPTRASIMTGKYPVRTGITDWIPGEPQPADRAVLCPKTKTQLALSEVTLAEALKEGGYSTSFVGKWHLGDTGHHPTEQGFDVNIAGGHWGHPKGPGKYYYPFGDEMPNLTGKPGDYLTDRLTDEAVKRIQAGRSEGKPFLICLNYYTVHLPLVPKKEVYESFNGKEKSERWKNQDYAAMVKSLDDNVGRLLQVLKDEGVDQNTLVIFYSDNGGLSAVTSNHPYRGGKGGPYEGGIKEPLIAVWPGKIAPGSICADPVTSPDFYPTLLDAAGLPLRPEQHIDGLSLVPLLTQEKQSLNRPAIYWHYPHFRRNAPEMPAGAVRYGDFKLIERYETGAVELYNLRQDIGETNNLAVQMPEKVQKLKTMLSNWRRETGAVMPQPNSDFISP